MTRGELKTRVARMIGLAIGSDDDGVTETALLEELANEAVIDILSRTRVLVRTTNLTVVADALTVDIPDTSLRVLGVSRTGSGETTASVLTEGDRDTLASDQYALMGFDQLLLGQAITSGDVITVQHVPKPTAMSNDSHDPSNETYGGIPVQFHRAILDYMCWHGAVKEGSLGQAEQYRILYEGKDSLGGPGSDLGRIKAATNMRGTATLVRRPRLALVGDSDTRFWG